MEIEERRVLRRKVPLLEAYLRLNSSTLKSLRDQGLIDRETSRTILKLKTRKEKIEYLVQNLDQHASPTTFDKICYYLEKEFLDVIADEMQVELQLERGKLPLAEYAVKEAKLLAYKLVADYEQLAEEDLENIASVLAARYVVARETAKRQKARTVKEEDQDMKSIQEDVTQMYEELQGFFNPMLGFGMGGEDNGEGAGSGFGFSDGFGDMGIIKEPSIVINGTEPVTEAETMRSMTGNYYVTPDGKSATSSAHSINGDHGDSYGNTDSLRRPDARTQDCLSPISEDMRNGQLPAETPLPADAREQKDAKEQKKSFMKMLNERMKTLSKNLQYAVKNYHKLVRERNSCLEVLGVKPIQDGQIDDVSLEEEIKKVIEESGYEPKTENGENETDDDSKGRYGQHEGRSGRRNYRRNKSNEGEGEMEITEEADGEDEENDSASELKEKLQEERDKVEQLEEELDYYKDQLEQMSKTRQMGYLYLSWYDEMVMNQALQPPGPDIRPVYSASNAMVPDRPCSGKPPIALRSVDSAGAARGRPASTGHSTHSARGARGGTRWVYYNPDFLEVGDGYVTLKTDQLPHAWSRESTQAGERRPPSDEHRRESPVSPRGQSSRSSPQGQPSRSSNPTPGQNKRFNSPDFKLPPTGRSGNLTGAPPAGGYVNGDVNSYPVRGNKGGKSVSIVSGNNRVYNGADSLDSEY